MPLPLGHAILGLTTQNLISQDNSVFKKWRMAVSVLLLANLPDIDVLIGLIFFGNGNAIHRGPTHSLLFAMVAGFVFSRAVRRIPGIPRLGLFTCSVIILSHIAGDHFFTQAPVSFFFPFENLVSFGHTGWEDVFITVVRDNVRDAGIIFGCVATVSLNLFVRYTYRALKSHAERSKVLAAVPSEPFREARKPTSFRP